ncbi:MAG: AraC family transcriptional regulator [Candidatus Nephrothrix sp. EaCA]|nr:MAG: AraC family transcriptional regulator [Candidatus Nephrothrix sp. EaCA]
MKNISKWAIPDSKIMVVKKLVEPHFDPTYHSHPEYQLFLVLEGTGMRFVGDTIKPFQKGDLVLTGPNLPHLWRNENAYFDRKNKLSTTGIVIYFHDYFLSDYLRACEELKNIQHLLTKSVCGLEITGKTNQVIRKMMIDILNLSGINSVIQLLRILETIALSAECHQITHKHYVPSNNATETDRINKIYTYIMKNFSQKIDLKKVAAQVYLTPSSFSRYFKSRVNKSFSDFLKEIRISHACKLLSEGNAKISYVGDVCGFQTLSNFNRQFKQVTRKSPLQYKKECQFRKVF